MSIRHLVPACLLIAALLASCKSGAAPRSQELASLLGKTIGVTSLTDISTLETRYVLQKGYDIDTSRQTSAVTFVEVPPDSLAASLNSSQLAAAVLRQKPAFDLSNDTRFHTIADVSSEASRLAGGPMSASVLLSYPDVVQQKAAALEEMNRLLAGSIAYQRANADAVLKAVVAATSADPEFVRWQARRQQLSLGDLSKGAQAGFARTWRMALDVGDIDALPEPGTVIFTPGKSAGGESGRATLSLAVLDDPSHRIALYAIEQGLVSSDKIDLAITYLAPAALAGGATAKQYDVVEGGPLAVVPDANGPSPFVIVSAGTEDVGSSLLFGKASEATPID